MKDDEFRSLERRVRTLEALRELVAESEALGLYEPAPPRIICVHEMRPRYPSHPGETVKCIKCGRVRRGK